MTILILISGQTLLKDFPSGPPIASRSPAAHSTSSPPFLYHEVIGADGLSATPMIMIHGFGANTYTWRHLVAPLADDRQIILLDLKGFGRSPKPIDDRYSPFDQANLVTDLILQLEFSSVILVGNSYGGGVALLVALKLLEERDIDLRGFILLDSIAYQQSYPYFIKLLRIPVIGSMITFLAPPALQVKQILQLAYYDDSKITEDQIKEYADPIRTAEGRHALVETARQISPADLEAITARYREISVPTLLVWGKDDRIVPIEVAYRLHQDLPNSDLRILARVGHLPHEEEPQRTLELIRRFLAKYSL